MILETYQTALQNFDKNWEGIRGVLSANPRMIRAASSILPKSNPAPAIPNLVVNWFSPT